MSVFASASFTGTAFAELAASDANWSKQHGYSGRDLILGASGAYVIRNDNTTSSVYVHSATPSNANYYVKADIAKLSGTRNPIMGVVGRAQSGADTMYQLLYVHSTNLVRLIKRVAGSNTDLGSSYSLTLTSTPVTLELRMDGDQISGYVNGVLRIGPVTDTAISAAGLAGISGFDMRQTGVADAGSIDVFEAGTLAPPAELTGTIVLDSIAVSGSMGVNPSQLTGTIVLDAIAPTGVFGAAAGTVRTLPFARNSGSRPTGLTGIAVAILSDDANLLKLAGATSVAQDVDGTVSYSGVDLPTPGTSVLVVTRESDGNLGIARYTVQ